MPSESKGFVVPAWACRCSNFGAIATFSLNGRRLERRMTKDLFDTELKRNQGVSVPRALQAFYEALYSQFARSVKHVA